MSNDRHLNINDGTIGNLFRRVTLATLGLDSMEGVSEQSFEVVDRADAFVERLLGGVSHVMPKVNVERMGTKATRLSDDIYMGMSGLNGPRNATDLGDWQYWLDAVLLTLFDEEEEEAVMSSASSSSVHATKRQVMASTSSAVRQRVAALKASGVRPAMLHALPAEHKHALIQELRSKAGSEELGDKAMSHAVSEALHQTLKRASEHLQGSQRVSLSESISAFDKIFNRSSRQTFASRMADKASLVSAHIDSSSATVKRAEVLELAQRWSKSIANLSVVGTDMTSVREMLASLDGLEKAGVVTHEQAISLRRAGQSYARQVLADEISNDVSAVADRIAGMLNRANVSDRSRDMLPSHRALAFATDSESVISAETMKRSFAALNGRLSAFNEAVASRVLQDGESAATVRWTRAADRFSRMQGISDEMDRVLLRDVVESAEALGVTGIIPKSLVESVTSVSQPMTSFSKAGVSSGATGSERTAEVLSHFGTSRVLGQLAGQVERSVEKLLHDISNTGIDSSVLGGFISDIHQIVATGRGGSIHDLRTSVQTSSVIESICAKLDAFADMAATSVVTRGYDDLSVEGTYVSTSEKSESSSFDSRVGSIRQLQHALATARAKSQEEAQRFVAAHLGARDSLSAEERKILESVSSAVSLENLLKAEQVMLPHLDSASKAELTRTIESVRKSHSHLESVSRQIQIVEDAVKLSSNLRKAAHVSRDEVARVSKDEHIHLDDVRVNGSYLGALAGTLASYAKIRDDYRVQGADRFASVQNNRIERMLSIVEPVSTQTSQFGSSSSDAVVKFARQLGSEVSFGYDEIIPSSMSMVHQSADIRYPSISAGDIASVLGHRKAVELYASELASGNGASMHALSESLQSFASRRVGDDSSKFDAFVSRGVNEAGERVQLSVGIKPGSPQVDGYRLKHVIGESYQPSMIRHHHTSSVDAVMTLKQLDHSSVSGAEQFVSVIAGLNGSATNQQAALASESKLSTSTLTSEGREAISSVLARFGMQAVSGEGLADETHDKLRLSVGGVNFDMSSHAFVQMVAKPVMSSVSYSMPSMMDANNALFSGYASLMKERGEQRSMKALRQLYIAEQARAGQLSAHSQVGFSTQSFADILGVNPVYVSASKPVRMDSSMEMARRQAAEDFSHTTSTGVDFSDDISKRGESISSREFMNDANYAWVSHAIQAHQGGTGRVSNVSGHARTDSSTQQLLGRIDSMFDYVESLSERNVGVFSTDETVRVLLEALPAESSLGNKGLPKWRQRDSKSARIAEARELREALARIGASPVQGTQRFANKQYVSPNLMPNQASGGAPLFSGGSDSGATPGGSANASGYSSDVLNEASIPDEDLQFIAEEVFHRIEESLCEEYQRRRSE